MQATALGHHLETLHDGLTTFGDGRPVPMPMVTTEISIRIEAGLAFVRTTRQFRNAEAHPIEAILTFPVGFDAVVTGLAATIDRRRLTGIAQPREKARETYEDALNGGQMAVLHEEVLRGIHILSVGALPPGAEVLVELEQTVPLADAGGVPFLRLPMTAGHVYGTSPLLPADDLVTANVRHVATLKVALDHGRAVLDGRTLAPVQALEIVMDRAVELRIEGGSFGKLDGQAADGRAVQLTLAAPGAGAASLDMHILVDRSGSTGSPVQDGSVSVWQAMCEGLAAELGALRVTDRVALWQFDSECQQLGTAMGSACALMVGRLAPPQGGTELAGAIRAALAEGAKDLLVLTDGQTWAHTVEDLKGQSARISAILVGPQSLDANIGHLCALTGGHVLYAPGRDVAPALRSAFAALRQAGGALQGRLAKAGPESVTALRGGVSLTAEWAETAATSPQQDGGDAVGRFAAALALPLFDTEAAEAYACAHHLCTHLTSLVLIDRAGKATEGLSRTRKVPLMASFSLAEPPVYASRSRASFRQGQPRMSAAPAPKRQPNVPMLEETPLRLRQTPPTPATGLATLLAGRRLHDDTRLAHALFRDFAWDEIGDSLLADDCTGLSDAQKRTVDRLAERLRSAFCAQGDAEPEPAQARRLALGLIACRDDGRAAARFARKALEGAPAWLAMESRPVDDR